MRRRCFMPPKKGYSKKSVGHDVGAEIRSGKPEARAVASPPVARKAAKKAGKKGPPWEKS